MITYPATVVGINNTAVLPSTYIVSLTSDDLKSPNNRIIVLVLSCFILFYPILSYFPPPFSCQRTCHGNQVTRPPIMPIREDVVVSAVSCMYKPTSPNISLVSIADRRFRPVLQDPNVVSSPIENQLSFLRAKNLTQEEIDAAFARAGTTSPPSSRQVVHQQQHHQQPPQQQSYYGGQYPPQPYGWQPSASEPLRRDWRDWFIMATVMGGVSYGLYSLTKVNTVRLSINHRKGGTP